MSWLDLGSQGLRDLALKPIHLIAQQLDPSIAQRINDTISLTSNPNPSPSTDLSSNNTNTSANVAVKDSYFCSELIAAALRVRTHTS